MTQRMTQRERDIERGAAMRRIDAMRSHPGATAFGPAIADLDRVAQRWNSNSHELTESIASLERALSIWAENNNRHPEPENYDHLIHPPAPAIDYEAHREWRARTREQIDATVSGGDIDYLAFRAGARRKRGRTLGQTQHLVKAAEAKASPKGGDK